MSSNREQIGTYSGPKDRRHCKKAMARAERRARKRNPEASTKRFYKGYND